MQRVVSQLASKQRTLASLSFLAFVGLLLAILLTRHAPGTTIVVPVPECNATLIPYPIEHNRIVMMNESESMGSFDISVLSELLPDTIEIVSMACNGLLGDVNYTTGAIGYTPTFGSGQSTVLDVFQYRGLDVCGKWHLVTQTVCSQRQLMPPLLLTACHPAAGYELVPYTLPMIDFVLGSAPIDWSTLEFVGFDMFTPFSSLEVPIDMCQDTTDAQRAMYPWGTSDLGASPTYITAAVPLPPTLPASTAVLQNEYLPPFGTPGQMQHILTHANNGIVTYSLTTNTFAVEVSSAYRMRVRVKDTNGLQSNTVAIYLYMRVPNLFRK